MENGCPSLADQLAACEQRIRELEQRDAEQRTVIAQQQEAIAAYQEQLAKAAEQLRFFKRAMFGQRRERYAPSPDQKLLFVPEAIEGLDTKAPSAEEAAADSPPPRTRRKPRRPRIESPQFWEHRTIKYLLPSEELPCGCCGAERTVIRTHVSKRAEMEEAKLYVVEEVRYTYGWPHIPSTGWSSGKKNPATLKPVGAANVPPAASPPLSRR